MKVLGLGNEIGHRDKGFGEHTCSQTVSLNKVGPLAASEWRTWWTECSRQRNI